MLNRSTRRLTPTSTGDRYFKRCLKILAEIESAEKEAAQAAAELAFTRAEIEVLQCIVHDTPHNAQAPRLVRNVIRLAQLGGYLARASDPPPGNTVMLRAMRRLTDIQLGYELALKRSG